jgi:hypothetical protein
MGNPGGNPGTGETIPLLLCLDMADWGKHPVLSPPEPFMSAGVSHPNFLEFLTFSPTHYPSVLLLPCFSHEPWSILNAGDSLIAGQNVLLVPQ